ncbi:cation-translocating P-type ATPase [Pediococcus claussenii]|uniref:Cation transporting ATPase n=1 Tax=Pediococcus claussenii (strain ATCC BAA-344 / DSM 14800 / JCM 18046 / KCTC 3811 / LMG 21948 / P06) TaxID=701521 RepID=G8PAS4_PEDCP|nr:Cation transporting ATPase [Pediococcus claussenii ATCC BAA-344]
MITMSTNEKDNTSLIAKMSVTQLYQKFDTSEKGLSSEQANLLLEKIGKNTIQKGKRRPQWIIFLKNFTSLMAILLWVSGFIAIFAQMIELGIAIWAVNIINGVFSFWQEHAAQKATDSLLKMLPTYTQVIRNGETEQINSENLVPGDIFTIQAGNSISADARILTATSFQVDESSLTGESVQVSKKSEYQHGEGRFAEANMVFAGTIAGSGTATALAVATGMKTEFGKIAKLTQAQKTTTSPLQKELNRLTHELSWIAITIGIAFFIAAIFFVHYPVAKSFIFALGMIVAFIPEGLLPTVTLSLAQGVTRMAKKHALVKELNSVETLGETTVICSDKTGTLTQNQMTVNHLWLPGKEYTVTGEGYVNNGKIELNQQKFDYKNDSDLQQLLEITVLNNNTKIEASQKDSKNTKIIGTPTEAALIVLAEKAGINVDAEIKKVPRLKEFPFDSDRKRMTTVHQIDENHRNIYVKGSLDGILKISDSILDNGQVRSITNEDRQNALDADEQYSKQGLRSLGIAYRTINTKTSSMPANVKDWTLDDTEQHLIFVGTTVMADPPRPEIYEAIQKCHNANIKVIMVTGDGAVTAKSIAVKIGVTSNDARVITGDELSDMTDEQLIGALKGEIIFARVAPEQKYRVVTTLQSLGHVVASTGDGVNDAPALKKADIGIAMGVTGTDVAKDAADMILTDDNFASIVAAIEEGRTVYSNIQKFLLYILNSNVSEAAPSVLFLFSQGLIPLPLTVMQILTVDLGTDMLPALGLGAERSEPGIMDQPPRKRKAHLLNRSIIWKAFAWYGLVASIISSGAYFFVNHLNTGWPAKALAASGLDYREATTMTLAAIVFCQIGAALNCRTQITSLFKIGIFSNHRVMLGILFEICLLAMLIYIPFLQGVFNTASLGWQEWLFLICIPAPLVLVEEWRKKLVRNYLSK